MEENDYCVRIETENIVLRDEVENLNIRYARLEEFYNAEHKIGDSLRKMVAERDAIISRLSERLRRMEEKSRADCV